MTMVKMSNMMKEIHENYDNVVREGATVAMDFPNLNVQQFAEKLLLIINWKSNYKNLGIVDVRTFYGTNTIQVKTYNKKGCYDMAKQLVESEEHITVDDEGIKFVNIDLVGMVMALEQNDVIEIDDEVVYVNDFY